MTDSNIIYSIFLIFTGAAVFATLALFARQAMIVAYIILGIILGPSGFALVTDNSLIADISEIGIMFLLYLLGLELLPQQLIRMLKEALMVTLISSLIFAGVGYVVAVVFAYSVAASILIAVATMFSSTIIGLKLLPTTILHHKHTGQIIISILLIQDIIAIIVLILLQAYSKGGDLLSAMVIQVFILPMMVFFVWLFQHYVLIKLLVRYEQIHEYVFLMAIAWCLGVAELAVLLGLSHEIGAFIAGVSLASSPIAFFVTEKLKPLRDFFLITFFFSLGAGFNMGLLNEILVPALCLAFAVIFIKPKIFEWLLKKEGEKKYISREVGFRLGQISEFSLLISVLAASSGAIEELAANMIQLATLITFLLSSFIVVRSYPTPIAVKDKLRRD